MEDSSATASTSNKRSREEHSEAETELSEGETSTPFTLEFKSFTVTPNLEDVRKELDGTKKEPLSMIVASHPTDMKDVMLTRAGNMLDLYLVIRQKMEALSKQEATNDDEHTPYIPSSLRMENPIAVPNRLKGNRILEEIVEEGKEENESRKMKLADIVTRIT